MMRSIEKVLVIGTTLAVCSSLAHGLWIAQPQNKGAATQPATRPAATRPDDSHKIENAPMLAVWRSASGSGGVANATELEFAVWEDGMELFRKKAAGSVDKILFLGKVDPVDVVVALKALTEKDFFSSAPRILSTKGTVVVARLGSHVNTVAVDWGFEYMPEKNNDVLTHAEFAQRDLWNLIVDSVQQLQEAEMSARLAENLDSKGEYRGYHDKSPRETWWISQAEKLWRPAKPAASAPSTRPAR